MDTGRGRSTSPHPAASSDVLVVGGGPAGAHAALRLARNGHRVQVVERRGHPATARGAWVPALTSAAALDGIDVDIPRHPVGQMRVTTGAGSTTTTWPTGAEAVSIDVHALGERLLDAAIDAGASVLRGHEAIEPIVERGFVRGAVVLDPSNVAFEARARYTLIADGPDSSFGRALGTTRAPNWPFALAHGRALRSPIGRATEAEIVLDLRDRSGTPITGFGWMYPSGGDHVGVGVLVWSTSPSFRVVRLPHLLDALLTDHGASWQIASSGGAASDQPATPGAERTGRLPLGNSVGPVSGPTYLVVGDAAGAASPWSGAGIEAAITTGALAADVLDRAVRTDATALQEYPQLVADRFERHYRVGRLAARLVGSPTVSTRVARWSTRRPAVADAITRVAAAPGSLADAPVANALYRVGRVVSAFAPDAER